MTLINRLRALRDDNVAGSLAGDVHGGQVGPIRSALQPFKIEAGQTHMAVVAHAGDDVGFVETEDGAVGQHGEVAIA